jgi:ribosome-binding factor A
MIRLPLSIATGRGLPGTPSAVNGPAESGANMVTRRQQRTNQLIRDEIGKLVQHETDDPLLRSLISITDVEVTQDLQRAKVFVSVLADGAEAEAIMQRLRKAARFFRRELAERLNLRHTPELDFVHDTSIARGARVLQLLREIETTPEASSS